jgi:hypothetical protein
VANARASVKEKGLVLTCIHVQENVFAAYSKVTVNSKEENS